MPYQRRLELTELLPLSYRREVLDCIFMYKVRGGKFGDDIKGICDLRPFWVNPRQGDLNTRLRLLPAHTETFQHWYTRRAPYLWNILPEYIRAMPYQETRQGLKRR